MTTCAKGELNFDQVVDYFNNQMILFQERITNIEVIRKIEDWIVNIESLTDPLKLREGTTEVVLFLSQGKGVLVDFVDNCSTGPIVLSIDATKALMFTILGVPL